MKKLTVKQLKKKAWKLTSEHNRRKDADPQGFVKCCTCPKVKHWKEMHAGHFIHKHAATYFEITNSHAQCDSCNLWKKGEPIKYAVFMLNRYGGEEIIRLEELSRTRKYWRRGELEELIELREEQLKSLPYS